MTPQQQLLTAAAAKDAWADAIEALALAATPGPWTCYGDHLVWPSEQGPAANDPVLAVVGEAHQDSAAFIAAHSPAEALRLVAEARAVAAWLRAEARNCDESVFFADCTPEEQEDFIAAPLALAAAILATPQPLTPLPPR